MNIKFSFMGGCFLVSMKFGRIIMAGGLNFFLFVLVIWFPDIIRIALACGVIVVVVVVSGGVIHRKQQFFGFFLFVFGFVSKLMFNLSA